MSVCSFILEIEQHFHVLVHFQVSHCNISCSIIPYSYPLIITSEWRWTLSTSCNQVWLAAVVLTHGADLRFLSSHYLLIYTCLCALVVPFLCITRTVTDAKMVLYGLRVSSGSYIGALSQLLATVRTVKGRCCRRWFEVRNDPGVAWLIDWFTQYFSSFAPEYYWKVWASHVLRASLLKVSYAWKRAHRDEGGY